MATHPLFAAQQAAQAAFDADDLNLAKLQALDAADAAFYAALGAARAEWQALPEGDAKASAETNAYDTVVEQEGALRDELYWLDIALRTYAMTPEGGW